MTASWSFSEELPKNGTIDGPYTYSDDEAQRAIKFFERRLRIPEGEHAGERYILPDWQRKYTCALYGWRTKSGRKRYRRGVVAVARGNLKSSYGAGLSLKGLVADGQRVPKVVGAGTDRGNAGIIYGYSSQMVRMEPSLWERLKPVPSLKRIVRRDKGGGMYEIISADATHAHGKHPTMLVVDDLQAQKSKEFLSVLETSQVTLEDHLAIYFMTAGLSRSSLGYDEWSHALRVMDNPELDEELLVAMFFASENDDLENPAVMKKANPSLGVSVHIDFLKQQLRRMKERPHLRAEVLPLHFNIWHEGDISPWLDPDVWNASAGFVDAEDMKGRECYVGIWAASASDIACVAYVFPGETVDVIVDSFVPADNVPKLEKRDGISYNSWINDGWLTTTEGNTIDEDRIVASIEARGSAFDIQEVAVNPRGTVGISRQLQAKGYGVVSVLQSFTSMSPSMRELEQLVLSRRLHHSGNRLLAWMTENLQVRHNIDGDIKPDTEKARGHTGGTVAVLMALSRTLGPLEEEAGWVAS